MHAHTHTFSLSLSLSHTPTHTHILSLSHMHTITLTLSHKRMHALLSRVQWPQCLISLFLSYVFPNKWTFFANLANKWNEQISFRKKKIVGPCRNPFPFLKNVFLRNWFLLHWIKQSITWEVIAGKEYWTNLNANLLIDTLGVSRPQLTLLRFVGVSLERD